MLCTFVPKSSKLNPNHCMSLLYKWKLSSKVKLLKIVVFVRKLVAFLIATMEKGCGGTVSEYTKYFIILSFSFK